MKDEVTVTSSGFLRLKKQLSEIIKKDIILNDIKKKEISTIVFKTPFVDKKRDTKYTVSELETILSNKKIELQKIYEKINKEQPLAEDAIKKAPGKLRLNTKKFNESLLDLFIKVMSKKVLWFTNTKLEIYLDEVGIGAKNFPKELIDKYQILIIKYEKNINEIQTLWINWGNSKLDYINKVLLPKIDNLKKEIKLLHNQLYKRNKRKESYIKINGIVSVINNDKKEFVNL